MKKVLFLAFGLYFGMMLMSCTDTKKTEGGAESAAAEEVDAAAEEAVQAYEAWLVKYDSLATKSLAGENVGSALADLNLNEGMEISEKLLATESKRNADQKARVKAVEEKADEIKAKLMAN
ncbi:MAG: hypothetical protein IJ659_08605 [Alloprevotella sp.]|nr:hypothetical protein [Alloprevotella sp.]